MKHFAALAVFLALALPAQAQTTRLPDEAETARLVWSVLIAVDQANRTGNYTVLRDLAAPGFQATHSAADLSVIFANLRARDPGLGSVLSREPVYREPPRFTDTGMLFIAGQFPGRPTGIDFEMLFEAHSAEWRFVGISVGPTSEAEAPSAEVSPAP